MQSDSSGGARKQSEDSSNEGNSKGNKDSVLMSRQFSSDYNHISGGNFDTMMESPNALRFMSPGMGGSERGSIVSKNRKRGGKNKDKGHAACCAPGQ